MSSVNDNVKMPSQCCLICSDEVIVGRHAEDPTEAGKLNIFLIRNVLRVYNWKMLHSKIKPNAYCRQCKGKIFSVKCAMEMSPPLKEVILERKMEIKGILRKAHEAGRQCQNNSEKYYVESSNEIEELRNQIVAEMDLAKVVHLMPTRIRQENEPPTVETISPISSPVEIEANSHNSSKDLINSSKPVVGVVEMLNGEDVDSHQTSSDSLTVELDEGIELDTGKQQQKLPAIAFSSPDVEYMGVHETQVVPSSVSSDEIEDNPVIELVDITVDQNSDNGGPNRSSDRDLQRSGKSLESASSPVDMPSESAGSAFSVTRKSESHQPGPSPLISTQKRHCRLNETKNPKSMTNLASSSPVVAVYEKQVVPSSVSSDETEDNPVIELVDLTVDQNSDNSTGPNRSSDPDLRCNAKMSNSASTPVSDTPSEGAGSARFSVTRKSQSHQPGPSTLISTRKRHSPLNETKNANSTTNGTGKAGSSQDGPSSSTLKRKQHSPLNEAKAKSNGTNFSTSKRPRIAPVADTSTTKKQPCSLVKNSSLNSSRSSSAQSKSDSSSGSLWIGNKNRGKPAQPGIKIPGFTKTNVPFVFGSYEAYKSKSEEITLAARQSRDCCGICAIHGSQEHGNRIFEPYYDPSHKNRHAKLMHLKTFICVAGCGAAYIDQRDLESHMRWMAKQPNQRHIAYNRAEENREKRRRQTEEASITKKPSSSTMNTRARSSDNQK